MNIIEKINRLKKERNAVILAHNYQLPEIQDIADYTGDSLGLSIEASQVKADVIVFCGVYFMAETAKILSPNKTVLIPAKNAGCPMADMINVEQLRDLKRRHPQAKVMCYVNSSAGVKAESDVCCTSANATMIAEKAFNEDDEIIFVPDRYLARYTATQVKRNFVFWPGFCPTHVKILPEYVIDLKKDHPEAEVLVHPECSAGVISIADQVLSTGGMSRYAKESKTRKFIIGTEKGMVYRLKKDNPDKEFYCASEFAICQNMKKTTLSKVISSLENMRGEVTLSEDIIKKARVSIDKMIEYTLAKKR
ncbi:MAG: quinolinate synthase NadA [PVC group bacterium]|nr:quinolinate synthase NadA [PVC group bacterium]